MDNENKKKILGNLTDEIHKEVFDVKNNHRFKNINETLKFLLELYKKEKIRQDLKRDEQNKQIDNSKVNEIENIIEPQKNI